GGRGGGRLERAVLFLIIFLWTPPHSWALALYRSEDYARAGVPMLPVAAGIVATKRQILLYSLPMAVAGVAPWFLGMTGIVYGGTAAGPRPRGLRLVLAGCLPAHG